MRKRDETGSEEAKNSIHPPWMDLILGEIRFSFRLFTAY